MTRVMGIDRASTSARRRARARVLRRDNYRCRLCGAPADDVEPIGPSIDDDAPLDYRLRAVCSRCRADTPKAKAARDRAARRTAEHDAAAPPHRNERTTSAAR